MTDPVAFALAWAAMLIWIGMVTYLIDMAGVMLGWWTNDTFWGVPKK